MPAGDYIEGLLLFGAMLGATLWGAWRIVIARLPGLGGADRVVALGLVATLGLLAIHVVPLALGVLSSGTVLVTSAIWAAAAFFVPRIEGSGGDEPAADDVEWPWPPRAAAALAVGLVGALVLSQLADRVTEPSLAIDVLNFHLPGVAAWIDTGSLWQIDVFLPNVAPGHYPNNGDVILLAAVLPWDNDFLAHLAMYPYFVLAGVAVYALARELGARLEVAAVVACLVLALPALAAPALVAGLVDAVMVFGFAAGLLFLIRHWRSGERRHLVLAGLALGVAFGTKWYGVSSVAIVVTVWIVAGLAARRGVARTARDAGIAIGLVCLAGGIWMLRNLVESGNPVFPVRVAPLGVEIFDAPRDIVRESAGFTLLDYVGDGQAWSEFIWPQLRRTLAIPAILIGAFLVIGLAWFARRRTAGAAALGAVLGATALLLWLAYLVTPYSAGGPEGIPVLVAADARYGVPALLVGAVVAACVTVGPRVAVAAGLLALAAIVDGARYSAGATLEAASLDPLVWIPTVAAVGAVAFWRADALRVVRAAGTPANAGVAVLLLAVAGIAGYEAQQRYNEGRYAGADPAVDALLAAAPSGRRVGLAGVWDDAGISPVLPAFGPRYGNDVEYVGPVVDEMVRRYDDADAFTAALERGAYDFLVLGNGRLEDPKVPELDWALAAGFEEVAASERLTLLAPAP